MQEDSLKCWQWAVLGGDVTEARVWPHVGGSFPSQTGLLHAPALPSLSGDYPALGNAGPGEVALECQLPAAAATTRGSTASSRGGVREPARLSSPLQRVVFIPVFPIKAECNAAPRLSLQLRLRSPSHSAGLAWVAPLPPRSSGAAGAAGR